MDPNCLDSIDVGVSDIDPEDEEQLEDMLGTQIDHTAPNMDAPGMDVDDLTPGPALLAVGTPMPIGKEPEPFQHSFRPSHVRPSIIPDNAEIIDLDSYECKNLFVHCSSLSPGIKAEEGMLSNADAGAQGQALSPDRNGYNGINTGEPSDFIMLDDDEEIQEVKQEPVDYQVRQDMAFGWREMSKETFEISDDDDGVVVTEEIIGQSPLSIFGPHINAISPKGPSLVGIPRKSTTPNSISPKERPLNGAFSIGGPAANDVVVAVPNVQSTDVLGVPRAFLRTPKPKPNATYLAKLEQIQKNLAERITGKPVVSGAGGIFRHPQVINLEAPLPRKSRKDDGGIPDENDHAWMEEISSESDEDDAAFRAARTEYRKKSRKGIVTDVDEIEFMRAKNQEAARQNRIQMAEERAQLEEEEEFGLFIAEDLPQRSSSKRAYVTMESDDEDLGVDVREEESDFARHQELRGQNMAKHQRQPVAANKKNGRNPLTAKDVDASMQEGMLIGNERDRKKAAAAVRAAKAAAKPETSKKTKKRKTKDGKSKGVKPKEGKSKAKDGKKAAVAKSKGPVMNNLDSLISNVIAEAQANEGEGEQPTFTNTRKADAFKELMASIPAENRKMASVDKQALYKATKKFRGHGSMKADGNGCWKLKGMTSSLRHYQLLGAAFMRDRELGNEKPLGGICADEMGFGKTVMMIANILDGRPADNDEVKTTLIVANPGLVSQWMSEIEKHCEPGVMGEVIRYHAGSRISSLDTVGTLRKVNIVCTTYSEISKSYPKCDPPEELVTKQQKEAWWQEHFEKFKGPLHRIMFHRVVLDESQAIKNWRSHISTACRGLSARHRWVLSGTPIQNRVEEFFATFSFLRVKHTGSYETFKKNFCDKKNPMAMERLQAFLRIFMIRRTHAEKIFNRPVLKLPDTSQRTTEVKFNDVERAIYDIVRKRFIKRINGYSEAGTLTREYRHVFTMVLRLRQLTGHIFLIQKTIQDLLEKEDVEKLMGLCNSTEATENTPNGTMLVQLRAMLATKSPANDGAAPYSDPMQPSDPAPPAADGTGRQFGSTVVSFKKYLRQLRDSSKWEELEKRSLCPECRQPPDTPWVTSCKHVYCQECISMLQYAAAKNDERAVCTECGEIFETATNCDGLEELGFQADSQLSQLSGSPRRRRNTSEDPEEILKWIDVKGHILPSAKTLAIKAQILNWIEESPKEKIIIFTQFIEMIRILGRICQQEEWGYCQYHGLMTLPAREREIVTFAQEEEKIIMIASLKSGGVGLNLTMASRVINVDLWWNSSVEQQAFCRVFRIGQEKETRIQRFTVINTVDEDMIKMQERKSAQIKSALGDDDGRVRQKTSVGDLMRLFGKVEEDEEGREFIWADDDEGEAQENVEMPPTAEERRYFRGMRQSFGRGNSTLG